MGKLFSRSSQGENNWEADNDNEMNSEVTLSIVKRSRKVDLLSQKKNEDHEGKGFLTIVDALQADVRTLRVALYNNDVASLSDNVLLARRMVKRISKKIMALKSIGSLPSIIVIVGGFCTGKSSLGNLLLGEDAFRINKYNETEETETKQKTNNGVTVYEVPSNMKGEDQNLTESIKQQFEMGENVIFIFTLMFEKKRREEDNQLRWMKKQFGEYCLQNHLFVAITHGDEYKCRVQQENARKKIPHQDQIKPKQLLENFKRSGDVSLFWDERNELQRYCQERYFIVNNICPGDDEREETRQYVLDFLGLSP